jgi:hypothetical protein
LPKPVTETNCRAAAISEATLHCNDRMCKMGLRRSKAAAFDEVRLSDAVMQQ